MQALSSKVTHRSSTAGIVAEIVNKALTSKDIAEQREVIRDLVPCRVVCYCTLLVNLVSSYECKCMSLSHTL